MNKTSYVDFTILIQSSHGKQARRLVLILERGSGSFEVKLWVEGNMDEKGNLGRNKLTAKVHCVLNKLTVETVFLSEPFRDSSWTSCESQFIKLCTPKFICEPASKQKYKQDKNESLKKAKDSCPYPYRTSHTGLRDQPRFVNQKAWKQSIIYVLKENMMHPVFAEISTKEHEGSV